VSCYICDKLGHISVDCPEFNQVKGNEFTMFGLIEDIGKNVLKAGKTIKHFAEDGKNVIIKTALNINKHFKEDASKAAPESPLLSQPTSSMRD
jgi:hypothetical protein